jgi:uncharacterized membrane protein
MKKNNYQHLLDIENEQLLKLNKIVLEAVEEEKLITRKIEEKDTNLPFSSRLADKVATFGGSWRFIVSFGFGLVVWILINVLWFHNKGFDPYPFILLNLILSCIAALQAPVIMMSQNRQEEKDRQRSQNDYLINLKAEIELRNLHQKIDLLIIEQMKVLFEVQKEQLDLLENINDKLSEKDKKRGPSVFQ